MTIVLYYILKTSLVAPRTLKVILRAHLFMFQYRVLILLSFTISADEVALRRDVDGQEGFLLRWPLVARPDLDARELGSSPKVDVVEVLHPSVPSVPPSSPGPGAPQRAGVCNNSNRFTVWRVTAGVAGERVRSRRNSALH